MAARSGELAMRPLPAVLLDLHEGFAHGRLTLKRGRVTKTVDLVNGNPVSTASSARDETLGHFLVATGVISEEQHRAAVVRAAEHGGQLGDVLVQLRVLTTAQLIDQLARQARHKLVQALRWPQGAWRFDPASTPAEGVQLRMLDVVFGGLRETAGDLDRLARLDGLTLRLTERGERLASELRHAFGDVAIAAVARGVAIDELERAVGERARARFAADALLLCDCVEAEVPTLGLGEAPPPVTEPRVSLPRAPTRPLAPGSALFDILFDDIGEADAVAGGAAPIELDEDLDAEDSGVVATADLEAASAHAAEARRAIAAEHQRIQGADHYAVLMVGRRAPASDLDGAYAARVEVLEAVAVHAHEARDRQRVDELRGAYLAARAALLDDRRRAAYDRELAGGELVHAPPAIDTELTFRMAEELMAKRQWAQAIGLVRKVIARSPGEADYHAALGWAEWMAGGERPEAADVARTHLNVALEINPDHAAAHAHKGRIDAALRSDDDEALFHLERAIDLDPAREDAIDAIEGLLLARGELRRYEKTLKRLLFAVRGRGAPLESRAGLRLARLYLDHLDEPVAAAAAAASARELVPRDPEAQELAERAAAAARGGEPARTGWREALGDPQSGLALVRSTEASGHADAAFLAASTMVALGTADAQLASLYEAHRVRGVALPTRPLSREQWALIRHRDDSAELGALIELLAPAIHAVAPMPLDEGELDTARIDDEDLPHGFLRVRQRCAALLGVPPPAVYSRVELGAQIHVIAADPPVLVAGDDALTAKERPELVFAVVRAMTFLWPGRAVGASRPGRVLKSVVMAVFREASLGAGGAAAGAPVPIDDPLAGVASDAIAHLAPAARIQARAAALRLLSRGGGLNLSLWARALSRTADRAGLLLCGDVPAAFAGAREVGELERDLIEFAYSAAHVQLRAQLAAAR